MKIKGITALVGSIIICVTSIIIAMASGLWSTEGAKVPEKFVNQGEFDGQYRADDIRGSYTFGDISKFFNIPIEHLADAFGVKHETAKSFQCKELETIFADSKEEIGTGSVRMFVAFYVGQPLELTESTYITKLGADIIDKYGNPSIDQKEYLTSHTVLDNTSMKEQTESTQLQVEQNKQELDYEQFDIMGSSYLKDLANSFAVPIEDIASAFLITKLEAQNFQVKDIKAKFANSDVEIGTSSVKIFIAFYKGITYDLSDTNAFLTKAGADIIINKGTPLEDQIKYLETHTAE